jgi:hypothetical protein
MMTNMGVCNVLCDEISAIIGIVLFPYSAFEDTRKEFDRHLVYE